MEQSMNIWQSDAKESTVRRVAGVIFIDVELQVIHIPKLLETASTDE